MCDVTSSCANLWLLTARYYRWLSATASSFALVIFFVVAVQVQSLSCVVGVEEVKFASCSVCITDALTAFSLVCLVLLLFSCDVGDAFVVESCCLLGMRIQVFSKKKVALWTFVLGKD